MINKYFKIILPFLFAIALALGLYQWQFNSPTHSLAKAVTLFK